MRKGAVAQKNGFFLLIALMTFLLNGCGYQIREAGTPVGIQIQSLAIPMISSSSSTLGFESEFTRQLRNEFIGHSRVPLVSESGAYAVLKGNVYRISTEALSYDVTKNIVQGTETNYATTSSRRIRITLDMKLVERETGKVIWHDSRMEEKASYAVGADPLQNMHEKKEAIREISRKLSRKIYAKTMERF